MPYYLVHLPHLISSDLAQKTFKVPSEALRVFGWEECKDDEDLVLPLKDLEAMVENGQICTCVRAPRIMSAVRVQTGRGIVVTYSV